MERTQDTTSPLTVQSNQDRNRTQDNPHTLPSTPLRKADTKDTIYLPPQPYQPNLDRKVDTGQPPNSYTGLFYTSYKNKESYLDHTHSQTSKIKPALPWQQHHFFTSGIIFARKTKTCQIGIIFRGSHSHISEADI